MRKRLLLIGGSALAAMACYPAVAATTVHDLGAVLNDSVSFPSVHTAIGVNTDYFEFELPTSEYVSASLSISGPLNDQLTGTFNLNNWTFTSGISPFAPSGALIESATVTPHLGGETAVLGTFTPLGDLLAAGNYFVAVNGTVPLGAMLSLAVDGNVTGIAGNVPEPSTWAMMLIGFGGLALAAKTRRTKRLNLA